MSKSNFDGEYTDEQFDNAKKDVEKFATGERWDELEILLRKTRFINLNFEKELLSTLTLRQFNLYNHYLKDEE